MELFFPTSKTRMIYRRSTVYSVCGCRRPVSELLQTTDFRGSWRPISSGWNEWTVSGWNESTDSKPRVFGRVGVAVYCKAYISAREQFCAVKICSRSFFARLDIIMSSIWKRFFARRPTLKRRLFLFSVEVHPSAQLSTCLCIYYFSVCYYISTPLS